MLSKDQLSKLTPAELLLLQKHIRLGKSHLDKTLRYHEIGQIFQLADIPPGVRDELVIDNAELAGTLSLVLNTIMSAILGAWVALTDFFKFQLDSKLLYVIGFFVAVLIGGYIGFQNSRSRKHKADEAVEKRKLQDVELSMIREINRKRKKEIKEKNDELISALNTLGVEEKKVGDWGHEFDVQAACLDWLDQISTFIKRKYKGGPIEKNLLVEVDMLKRSFDKKVEHEEAKDAATKSFNQIIDKLSHLSSKPPLTFESWLRANYRELLLELIPTLFGGLSSLFVYLNGDSVIPEEGIKQAGFFDFLLLPEMKLVQLLSSLAITFYFAFTFIHLNRKAFKRDQELAKEQTFITREEDEMTLLDDQLLKVKEALNVMQKLEDLFRFAKQID